MDARQERADEVAGLLASRQDALHRFAAAVLGRSRAPNLEGEPDTGGACRGWAEPAVQPESEQRCVPQVKELALEPNSLPFTSHPSVFPAATAFREWFLAQMAASDALLHQLRVGEDSTAAASHLQAAMERLGLTAAELARMRDGELAGGEWRSGCTWDDSREAQERSCFILRSMRFS
jgi:hypothetical protein